MRSARRELQARYRFRVTPRTPPSTGAGRGRARPTPAMPAATSQITERADAFVADAGPTPRPSAGASPTSRRPGALRRRLRDRPRGARRSRVPRRAAADRAGDRRLHGVRWPLIEAVKRGFRETRRGRERTTRWLFVADRLLREPKLEARWFAFGLLERPLDDDPERTWQLIRRAAREAGDWITVDALAHPFGKGILAEAYRWAELEQLVYCPSRWERRLVGSTIATMPFVERRRAATRGRRPRPRAVGAADRRRRAGRPEGARRGRSARWPRSISRRPRAFATEAELAAATDDGHRAWVIRDALSEARPGRRAEQIRDPPRRHPPPAGRAVDLRAPPRRPADSARPARHAACPSHRSDASAA